MDLIAEYEKHLRRLDRSPNTITTYIRTLRQADRELPEGLAGANTEELEEWLFAESPARPGGGERGKTTRSHYVRILKGFGKWSVDPKRPDRIRRDHDATAELPDYDRAKRKPKPISEAVLNDILARAAEPHRTWYLLAAYAGLRCCEISGLDAEHVTAERIWVIGKGDRERFIPTHPLIWQAVKDLPPGPVAVADGVRVTPIQVGHRGNHQLRKMGYSGVVSMHRLRHRFATRAFDVSRDLVAVQELLGHSDVGTTRGYVEVNRDRMAAAVAGLPVAV